MAPNEPDATIHPRMHIRADADVTPAVAASRRASNAMRRVITGAVNTGAPADVLDAIADDLQRIADRLEPYACSTRYDGTGGIQVGGDNSLIFETHPLIGPSNPLAPPLVILRDGNRTSAGVTYGHPYEGPPGRVHGGMIAAGFDMVIGAAAALSGEVFFTGTLTVRYLAATPLHVPLRYEATLGHIEGRRLQATGRLLAGDVVTAEGEGVFVIMGREFFDAT